MIAVILIIGGMSLASLSEATGPGAVVLTLKEAAEVDGPAVAVAEVAAVGGSDDRAVERVRQIEVCSAPIPGHFRTVSRAYVERSLRKNGVNPADVRFEGAPKARVTTASVVLTAEDIRAWVQQYMHEQWVGAPGDLEIEFRSVPSSITLARRQEGLRVVLPEYDRLKGNVVFHLEAGGDGKTARRFPISARIRTFQEVAVTARRIGRHHVLGEGDLCLERWETTDLGEVFLDIPSAVGLRTDRIIDSGRVLRGDMVERPPLVQRGDVVTVLVSVGRVSATIYGEARQDGGRGERIRVRNLQSGKGLIARVLDTKRVEVEAGR